MDAGEELVDHLFKEMQIDEDWAVRRPRGFTWWAGPLAQHVWSEPPVEDFGHEISRVHVQTDLLTGFTPDERSLRALSLTSAYSTMSGYLLGEGVIRSATSVFVHRGTLVMWKHLLTIAALVQVTAAHIDIVSLLSLTGARPAMSGHPQSGERETHDDMLNVIKRVFAPMGAGPSWFIGEEFRAAEKVLGPQVSVLTTASSDGLTSEFPYGNGTALLQMRTDIRNPRLGSGLMLILSLPTSYPPNGLPQVVLDMNRWELTEFSRLPFLGSWSPHASLPGTLAFVMFLPNACAMPGLPSTLLSYFASRAKWALEVIEGGSYEESRKKARPALLRFFGR